MEIKSGASMVGIPTPVEIPSYAAAGFNLLGTPTELVLVINSTLPGYDENNSIGLLNRPEAFIRLSPTAAKELMVLLQSYVAQIESQTGELTSDFLASRAKEI